MQFIRKDILDIASLTADEITLILDTAVSMKEISERPIKKVPTLRGKTIVLFFHEPSTRTKLSFDIAAKRLSADVIAITASSSSLVKGESFIDMARNLEAMYPDIIVIRHSAAGAPHMLAKALPCSVINAGDGMHAHPSQALLDLMSVREKKGAIDGLKIAIIGDIAHSRVARSNIYGFSKMGAKVTLAGPPTMLPPYIEQLAENIHVCSNVDEAVQDVDIIMMLRMQKERQQDYLFPTEREYAHLYGLTRKRLERARDDVLVMHPGPMNRGVEIDDEVADGSQSIILEQVTNGVALRMALFYLVAKQQKENEDE